MDGPTPDDGLSAAREALRRAERALAAERLRARGLLDASPAIVCALDAGHRITAVNRRGVEILGHPEGALAGRRWLPALVPEAERAPVEHCLVHLGHGGADTAQVECGVLAASGEQRTIAWHLALQRDAEGRPAGVVASGEDVTGRRRAEQQVTYLAFHDALTGLPNRRLLEEHLKLAMARSRRSGAGLALLHLDLDGFKLLNDSLGHAGGDRLLRAVAQRVRETVRATDLLARPGGDELLLLMADLQGDAVSVAEDAAARLLRALEAPFEVDGEEVQVGCSIGISLLGRDARDAAELLEHADSAMYRAKAVARGGWAVHAHAPEDPRARLTLSTGLRRALARDELRLHFQPIFDLPEGRLRAVEALLRWQDPERGLVSPGDFVGVAEQTGLIEPIGDWVVGAVCAQQVAWSAHGWTPHISFNVSPRQLRRLDFAERVAAHLRRTGADPSRLTVELTESTTMEDPAGAEPVLRALHRLGLHLALDDFGSGYSSLSRLREMPVRTLKIDRRFLRAVPDDPQAAAIVTAILRLARALGRTAVAEGVETEAQRQFLVAEGCPLVQGFLLARPLPPAELEPLLAGDSVPASPGA